MQYGGMEVATDHGGHERPTFERLKRGHGPFFAAWRVPLGRLDLVLPKMLQIAEHCVLSEFSSMSTGEYQRYSGINAEGVSNLRRPKNSSVRQTGSRVVEGFQAQLSILADADRDGSIMIRAVKRALVD